MERDQQMEDEENHGYDGAIHQITPAPEHFVPQGALQLDRREEIVIKRKPHRNRPLASFLYL